ncbi:hypothetical protein GCM10023188_25890 [Pontibacter saemangeumensis]|uniref:PH domain-containing protein n=1 Tax=Pontibacter saemangeumensis TaxID=1084525 RepID=A0ABP8LRM4_9BACT
MLLASRIRLEKKAKEWVAALQKSIAQTDTGQYLPRAEREAMAATVGYAFTDTGFELFGGQYIWTYEYGRGPTVNDGDGAVRRYVRRYIDEEGMVPKGQDKNGMPIDEDTLAFFISRKIHETGSKPWRNNQPTGVLSGIINDEAVVGLEQLLSEPYAIEIAQYLTKAAA